MKLVDGLVPEADVILHDIFRGDAAPSHLQSGLETEGNADGDGSDVSEEEVEKVPGPFLGIKRVNTVEASTTSAAGDSHDFSPGWLERQALTLLDRIEKHRAADGVQSSCPVLLAGCGFGGLVVKQASTST